MIKGNYDPRTHKHRCVYCTKLCKGKEMYEVYVMLKGGQNIHAVRWFCKICFENKESFVFKVNRGPDGDS